MSRKHPRSTLSMSNLVQDEKRTYRSTPSTCRKWIADPLHAFRVLKVANCAAETVAGDSQVGLNAHSLVQDDTLHYLRRGL